MIKFTKEQLKQYCEAIIAQHEAYALPVEKMPDDNQALVLMAKTTLASLTAEPAIELKGGKVRFLAIPVDGLFYAAPPAPVVPDVIGEIRVGRLPTMNQDEYPGLGDWWVQLRIGEDSDEVLARVYGATPQEANIRAEAIACRAAMLQSAEPKKYNIGEATMRHIFTSTGMTNVSDMQAVFDRVEEVLSEMEGRNHEPCQ